MQRFRSMKTLQKFSSVQAQVQNHFNQERHLITRQVYKQRRSISRYFDDAVGVADLFHRHGIRAKPLGDDAPRLAIFLHDALQELERCGLVPLRGDHRFENLAFVIDSSLAKACERVLDRG